MKKRALFCQMLQGAESDYRTLMSFGLILEGANKFWVFRLIALDLLGIRPVTRSLVFSHQICVVRCSPHSTALSNAVTQCKRIEFFKMGVMIKRWAIITWKLQALHKFFHIEGVTLFKKGQLQKQFEAA